MDRYTIVYCIMTSVQTIRFCDICENKLYHQIHEDALTYYCRVCHITDDSAVQQGACVLNIQYGQESARETFDHIVNKYTKQDPTLPHIQLPCPNEKCSMHGDNKTSDVIYLRYDNTNIKHLYMCTACDFTWKTNE